MTRYIRVDYTVKPDVDLGKLKAAIAEFVAGIHSHHPEHRYSQKQPFFQHFTGYLREQWFTGPEVTRLDRVASTVAQPTPSRMDR